MNLPRSIHLLLFLAMFSCALSTRAQTCTVASSSGMNFGTNLKSSPTDQIDVNGTIELTCIGGGNGQPRRACLALGTGAPVPNPRTMTAGAGALNFQVYDTSTSGTIIATSGSESTGMIMERAFTSGSPSGTPVNVSFPIAARMFSGQTATSGSYIAALAISTGAGNITASGCAPSDMVPQGTNLIVNAQVGADCTLDIPDVSFGTVTRLTSPIDTSTNATVTCTSGAPWTLSLNAGSSTGNTYATRRMSPGGIGTGVVQYQIYRDPGPANVWGNGTGGTVTRTGTGVGVAQTVPIYLQVPAQAPHPEGTYSDRVTATLTF
jgi:spore coat protein U-like protein